MRRTALLWRLESFKWPVIRSLESWAGARTAISLHRLSLPLYALHRLSQAYSGMLFRHIAFHVLVSWFLLMQSLPMLWTFGLCTFFGFTITLFRHYTCTYLIDFSCITSRPTCHPLESVNFVLDSYVCIMHRKVTSPAARRCPPLSRVVYLDLCTARPRLPAQLHTLSRYGSRAIELDRIIISGKARILVPHGPRGSTSVTCPR